VGATGLRGKTEKQKQVGCENKNRWKETQDGADYNVDWSKLGGLTLRKKCCNEKPCGVSVTEHDSYGNQTIDA